MSSEIKAVVISLDEQALRETRKVSVPNLAAIVEGQFEDSRAPHTKEEKRTIDEQAREQVAHERNKTSRAKAFDNLSDNVMKLVESVERLIRVSYITQFAQLFVLLVQIIAIGMMLYVLSKR